MTISQFNNAVEQYCKAKGIHDTLDRFIATIGGNNVLYTKLSQNTDDFELAHSVGLSLGVNGIVFADVSNIPTQFEIEGWKIPAMYEHPDGIIEPSFIEESSSFLHTGRKEKSNRLS